MCSTFGVADCTEQPVLMNIRDVYRMHKSDEETAEFEDIGTRRWHGLNCFDWSRFGSSFNNPSQSRRAYLCLLCFEASQSVSSSGVFRDKEKHMLGH